MRRAGARTYAQDRETSAVWGMPAAAAEMDAAEKLVPLHDIPALLLAQGPAAAA
jgi:chemotaxis response regulator CheB